ncbi:UNVERIFIED_CONTAM: Serine carboxypeptidase-like 17 [Sesamum latifolium]|uniref:Serine carboxypeptidase-like 17 n=1 Tax=Sesamum latifolium TaxID=2727402 RepID=A0AAW2UZ57_9LAMI
MGTKITFPRAGCLNANALVDIQGTITEWKRCNRDLSYEQDVESVLLHHRLLIEKGFRVLAYSGDHDMTVPYLSTLKWIRNLNLTLNEDWRPWTVDNQVAGVQVI